MNKHRLIIYFCEFYFRTFSYRVPLIYIWAWLLFGFVSAIVQRTKIASYFYHWMKELAKEYQYELKQNLVS